MKYADEEGAVQREDLELPSDLMLHDEGLLSVEKEDAQVSSEQKVPLIQMKIPSSFFKYITYKKELFHIKRR